MTAIRELAERWRTVPNVYGSAEETYRECADELLQILDAEGDAGAVGGWIDGYPNHVYASEWFIAQTVYNDRVVLRALPDEYSFDFTTADHTYMSKENIKRWMQFPDSDFIPSTHPQPVRSGVVSDEQVEAACAIYFGDEWPEVDNAELVRISMHEVLTHFAKSLPAVDGGDKRDAERYRWPKS